MDGDELDPHEAARLLVQTQQEAHRQFDLNPRWITAVTGAVVLLAYGALWITTRGQRPYTGPNLGVVALVYAAVAIAIAAAVKVYRRATSGISGAPVRQQQAEGLAILASFVLGSPVLQGALKHDGASDAIVYGVIPAAAPLIVVGTTVLGIAAAKADWRQCAAAFTVVTAGVAAAFAGPSGAWLTAGIGLLVGMVVYAAIDGARPRGESLPA
jgi:hypothetical protein